MVAMLPLRIASFPDSRQLYMSISVCILEIRNTRILRTKSVKSGVWVSQV